MVVMQIAQLVGRMSKGFIEDSPIAYEKEEFEWRRLSFLVISSIIYCSGATWLVIVSSTHCF
jgi:biotin transporter BioY